MGTTEVIDYTEWGPTPGVPEAPIALHCKDFYISLSGVGRNTYVTDFMDKSVYPENYLVVDLEGTQVVEIASPVVYDGNMGTCTCKEGEFRLLVLRPDGLALWSRA